MPITRKQFELEIDSATEERMKRVHAFLTAHKDQAFTESELHDRFEGELAQLFEKYETFGAALEKLVDIGVVEKRRLRNVYYYAYAKDLTGVL